MAILAADVAGYSRLMGSDEEGTLSHLKVLRRTLVDPAIAAIDQLSLARHGIMERAAEPSGEVRVGLPGTISQSLSVPLLIERESYLQRSGCAFPRR